MTFPRTRMQQLKCERHSEKDSLTIDAPSLPAQPPLLGAFLKSEYAHSEPVWLNLMPYSSLIWESEVEEGAVAVCRAAFLAAETLSTSTFWPPPASVRRRQSDRPKGERTLPPWDSQRPHFPSNSFRPLFSLQLELWALLRFFWCEFDSKDKCFFPPFNLLSAPFSCFVEPSGKTFF